MHMSSVDRATLDRLKSELEDAVSELKESSSAFKNSVDDLDVIVSAVANSYNTEKGKYVQNDLSSLNIGDLDIGSTFNMNVTCSYHSNEERIGFVGVVEDKK